MGLFGEAREMGGKSKKWVRNFDLPPTREMVLSGFLSHFPPPLWGGKNTYAQTDIRLGLVEIQVFRSEIELAEYPKSEVEKMMKLEFQIFCFSNNLMLVDQNIIISAP